MTALPKISVIMPSLNQGSYLEEAILSVTSQEYPSVELIVIDGGSNDNSVEVIKRHANKIHYWISEKDRGQSHAINKGLQQVSGDIVTWLNSDDAFLPGALRKASAHFLDQSDTDILHGKAVLFGKGRRNKVIGLDTLLKPHEYLPYMRFPQPASFSRKKIMDACGPLNENLHYAMDHELVVKAILTGARFAATTDLLARYRLHDASKSMNDGPFVAEWSLVLANVFVSVPGGEKFAERLYELKLVKEKAKQRYNYTVTFSGDELHKVYLEHLHLLFHAAYRQADAARCRQLYEEVSRHNKTFAEEKGFTKYLRRLELVPQSVFKLYRRFTQ